MPLLPPDDDLDLIHTRRYETRVYQISDEELLARGAISDEKPPGLYIAVDPEPLEVHQMQLELRVAYPKLEITAASVVFETHPHAKCPLIAADYQKLVGLSITRGFTHKTRDLFGGPNGCTHTNALLQAMAPAVVQATWSLTIRNIRRSGGTRAKPTPEALEARIRGNRNTCHIWAEDGEHIAAMRKGKEPEPLIPVHDRLRELGIDDDVWG